MLVLHEGQIPYNPKGKSYKIGLLHGKEDIVYLDEIFNKGIELLKYNVLYQSKSLTHTYNTHKHTL